MGTVVHVQATLDDGVAPLVIVLTSDGLGLVSDGRRIERSAGDALAKQLEQLMERGLLRLPDAA